MRWDDPAPSRLLLQELQQVDLGLDGAAADRGELHRFHRAREMPPRLVVADDAPAHRAEHFPPMRARRIDLGAARALVGGPQFLAAAEAAGRLVDGAEAPALDAQPAEILDRDRRDGRPPSRGSRSRPLRRRDSCRCGSRHAPAPAVRSAAGLRRSSQDSASSNTGCGWLEQVERAAQAGDVVGGLAMGQRRQVREYRRHGCAPGSRRAGPRSSSRAFVIGRIAQELAGDRRAADPAHDEGLAQPVLRRELEQHFAARARPPCGRRRSTRNSVARSSAVARSRARRPCRRRRRIAAQDQAVALAVRRRHRSSRSGARRRPIRARAARSWPARRNAGRPRRPGAAATLSASDRHVNGHSPDCGTGPAAW